MSSLVVIRFVHFHLITTCLNNCILYNSVNFEKHMSYVGRVGMRLTYNAEFFCYPGARQEYAYFIHAVQKNIAV